MSPASDAQHARVAWTVGLVSAALLGFEIALMRILLVGGWHHFAFLVISMVMLGLGVSGTVLCLGRDHVMPRAAGALWVLTLATAASMPLCTQLAQLIPVEARMVPAMVWRQLGCWLGYWALLTIPFFFGGAAVGLGLMMARQRVGAVYAANLVGSAAGGMFATIMMHFMPAEWLPVTMGAFALAGSACLGPWRRCLAGVLLCGVIVSSFLWMSVPHIQPDPDKYSAYLQRLERQGTAHRIAVTCGPRSLVEAYESEAFHELPFVAVGALPPPMSAVTIDGHWAASVLDISDADEAEIMDRSMMAFAYVLAPAHPRVLLLGERGGANIWLARRRSASAITVVQPDANLLGMLRGPLSERGGSVLEQETVQVISAECRHFVDHHSQRFDVIQLAAFEGSAAGSGGMGGLTQDHMVTVEGIAAGLECLTSRGVLFVCRGMQTPPRDNLKLLATFVEALRCRGVSRPEEHVAIVRDYLAVCTVVTASPLEAAQVERIRRACVEHELTPVWFPGIRADELNHPDELPTAPDGQGDWYNYGARRLFSSEAEEFVEQWSFAIRPATDDRPFFFDFCKLRAVQELREAFGGAWVTRIELAFPLVLAAAVFVGLVGAGLTLLPLALARTATTLTHRAPTAAYFAALGLAYLLVEMTFLSRLTLLIGDPVQAAAVTICTFLLASGLGSLTAQRWAFTSRGSRIAVFAALLIVGGVELTVLHAVALAAGSWPLAARWVVAAMMSAPLAYLMGFPMPIGLARLDRARPPLVPWAWGVNGFASVLAAPLATILGMTWGFSAAGASALMLYLAAALLLRRLPGTPPEGPPVSAKA